MRALQVAALAVFAVLAVAACPRSASAHAHEEHLAFFDEVARGPFWEAMQLLSAELVVEARPHVEELARREPNRADTHRLRARQLFMENQFEASIAAYDEARKAPDYQEDKVWTTQDELVRSTWETVKDHQPHPTSGGHFVLWIKPGIDEVLIPYADDALEKAYAAFGEIFGYVPPEPVQVYVFSRKEDLAAATFLTVDDILNSGTIALCKHNRLMITSPWDTVFGYDWLDTLAHEYIHYVIIKASRNTVPIWIHEGLAKFFENRWKEAEDNVMLPRSQTLLAQALAEDRLITFQQMSPSMAKLPTPEATGTAFAEVFTVADFLKRRRGEAGVRQLIAAMRDGMSDKEAIASVFGTSFNQFETDWRDFLNGLKLMNIPGVAADRLVLKGAQNKDAELELLQNEKAEKHTYLGDRLRAKDRYLAAMKEYEKGMDAAGGRSGPIASKLAVTYRKLGKFREATTTVDGALAYDPEFVLLYLHAGLAHLALGEHQQAADRLQKAVLINPFDREAHEGLARAYEALGRTDLLQREKRAIEILAKER